MKVKTKTEWQTDGSGVGGRGLAVERDEIHLWNWWK